MIVLELFIIMYHITSDCLIHSIEGFASLIIFFGVHFFNFFLVIFFFATSFGFI